MMQIRIVRKPNYGGVVAFSLLLLLVGGFLYIRRNSLEFLNNRNMYAWVVVVSSGSLSNLVWHPVEWF